MYHSSHSGFGAEAARFPRTPASYTSGRTGGGGVSPYGDNNNSQQAGQYPSPYQARYRLHSKQGNRGYKRRANTSAGGDGASVYGGGGSGVGLGLSSTSAHTRGRTERDRFLVDINSGGQRTPANPLLQARKDSSDSSGGAAGGSMWLPSSSHRATRLSGSGRPNPNPHSNHHQQQRLGTSNGYSGVSNIGGAGRTGDFSRGGSAGGDGCGSGGGGGTRGRISVPQRYNRSRERQDCGSAAGGNSGVGAGRRGGRYRHGAGGGESAGSTGCGGSAGGGKLPSIGGGGGNASKDGGGIGGGGSGSRQTYPRANQQYGAGGGGGKQLVVLEEGSETCGVCTIQGLKPSNPRWENQDNYVMKEDLAGLGVRLFVVLDGHGELGHLVSRRCSAKIPNLVVDSSLSVARATLSMADDLRSCPVDCSSSGATCVLTTIHDGKISVANLGDSKCVLARLVNGQTCAVPLSEDHKPDRPDERQRILAIGGQVGSRHLVVGSSPSGPIRIPMGPARVWYRCRGEIMGLAMSRSLGDDIAHQAGVSSEPEVMEHEIDANDQFLILATDGVWDVTEIGQAVQIVQGYASRCRGNSWDPQGAASLLAHSARKRWEGLSAVVDDITALVVRLNVS